MTKTHKYTNSMLYYLLFCCFLSCNNKVEEKEKTTTLYRLINKYEPAKEFEFSNSKQPYFIEDSLNILFKKLNPNNISKDTSYRKAMLYFLEKKYIYIYQTATNKDAFYVCNASAWGGNNKSVQFALNIFNKIPLQGKDKYDDYLNKTTDITCIDLIINETKKYKIENEEHKQIHTNCLKLMPTKCLDQ